MNKTSNYEFTICIPVYNEEENLPRVEERLRDFLPKSIKKGSLPGIQPRTRYAL